MYNRELGECRLIINWDQANMWALQLTYAHRHKAPEAELVKAMIEEIVDEHSKANIDRVVHCVFALPWGAISTGFKSFYRSRRLDPMYENVPMGTRQLEEAGYDLTQVILDRSHKKGMEFVAGIRMNDRHEGSADTPLCREHPEWRLEEFPGGMDYKYEGVRKPVLAFVEEFLDRYDVDGIELDWLRWCHMFKRSEAVQNTPILTEFMAKMRKTIDHAADKRGRTLVFGVRIPQNVDECTILGFDVSAWIQSRFVDYVCPSDFFHTDFNIITEDFVALTKGTSCKVYPSIHPRIALCNNHQVHSPDSYRAAAKNYYAYGADGISVYNYQYHWRSDMGSEDEWPRALGYLTSLRDPKQLESDKRRYMYYPLWPAGECPTGDEKHDILTLVRGSNEWTSPLRLRMAEDLNNSNLSAILEFKVTGMETDDVIEVRFNGNPLAEDQVRRLFVAEGQPAKHGRLLPAYCACQIDLHAPPAVFGDNQLQLRLKENTGLGVLVAQEFEICVEVNASF